MIALGLSLLYPWARDHQRPAKISEASNPPGTGAYDGGPGARSNGIVLATVAEGSVHASPSEASFVARVPQCIDRLGSWVASSVEAVR